MINDEALKYYTSVRNHSKQYIEEHKAIADTPYQKQLLRKHYAIMNKYNYIIAEREHKLKDPNYNTKY